MNEMEITQRQWNTLISGVPQRFHEKIYRFHKWQDRQASLFGKLLLKEGLQKFGYSSTLLNEIFIDKYERPSININLDFNISHSNKYVVCAFNKIGKIGIDVEEIRDINISDFRSVLTKSEINQLHLLDNSNQLFFNIWTKKEAVIKAEGKGFFNALQYVDALKNEIFLDNRRWFVEEIPLAASYVCHFATQHKVEKQFEVNQITFI